MSGVFREMIKAKMVTHPETILVAEALSTHGTATFTPESLKGKRTSGFLGDRIAALKKFADAGLIGLDQQAGFAKFFHTAVWEPRIKAYYKKNKNNRKGVPVEPKMDRVEFHGGY